MKKEDNDGSDMVIIIAITLFVLAFVVVPTLMTRLLN